MNQPDPHAAPEPRWPEFMRQWLDAIGTPSLAMLPTPNSVPVIQRIDDVVARATHGMEHHADRVRDAQARAAAWRAEAARATSRLLPDFPSDPATGGGPTAPQGDAASGSQSRPPGRIDRVG